ncbi:MAG: hypothetical protein ACR2F2_10135 [Pyrinomonadaceae bacterium]
MQTIRLIKKLEFKVLLILTISAFVFSISGYVAYLEKDQKERDAYFQQQVENREKGLISFSGPYCFPDKHPQFLLLNVFLIGLLLTILCFTRIYFFSFSLLIILIGRFAYWYFDSQQLFKFNETAKVNGLDNFFYKANYFDVATFTILIVLCLWQLSILSRMLFKKLLKKDLLP